MAHLWIDDHRCIVPGTVPTADSIEPRRVTSEAVLPGPENSP
jgi:hypothetical protein